MKTAILITARLKSTRLPKKVMRPIYDRPMIGHMIDRLRLAEQPEGIIICTSTLPQDDPLVDVANQEGVLCYRGDPDDVLMRITEAASQFAVDTVVSCTADNPFVDPIYIDRLVEFHCANGYDYSNCEGLPLGSFSYVVSRKALKRACTLKAERDTEVWGGYFTETGHFSWGTLHVTDPAVQWPELRLTVDTPDDFELITRIFDELYEPGEVFPLSAIVDLCRRRPDLVALNAHVQQKAARPIKMKSTLVETND